MSIPVARRRRSVQAAAAALVIGGQALLGPAVAATATATATTAATAAAGPTLPSITVGTRPAPGAAQAQAYEGVVEALRQTVIAAQVPGAVLALPVRVGDRVRAGQLLLRLDARAADQGEAASQAQVQAARAQLELATRDVERQRALQQRHFISQAALERAEAEFKAAQAQANAQLAQAGAARTQTSFHLIRAPFAGVVSELPVQLGDMAMPGKPLLTLVDPGALRVSATVPQSVAARLGARAPDGAVGARVELPALPAARRWLTPSRLQVLPTADAATHTVVLRAELPPAAAPAIPSAGGPGGAQDSPTPGTPPGTPPGPMPGMFARLWLPATAPDPVPATPPANAHAGTPAVAHAGTPAVAHAGTPAVAHAGTPAGAPAAEPAAPAPAGASPADLRVPLTAVVRRAELTALYVLDDQGRPLLRQVRLGPVQGEQVQVLAGLAAGERVVTDPQAASRWITR